MDADGMQIFFGGKKISGVIRSEPKLKVNLSCILKHTAHCGSMPAMQFANSYEWLDLCRDFAHVFLFDQQKRNIHCQLIKCQLMFNYSAQMVWDSAELKV